MKSVHVSIEGCVQGAWYCAWTTEQAKKRGLDGWVRNRTDGTVEAVFSGEDREIDAMLLVCESGPPLTRVENVFATPCDPPSPGFTALTTE